MLKAVVILWSGGPIMANGDGPDLSPGWYAVLLDDYVLDSVV